MPRYFTIQGQDAERMEEMWNRYDRMAKNGDVRRTAMRERLMDAAVAVSRDGQEDGTRHGVLIAGWYPYESDKLEKKPLVQRYRGCTSAREAEKFVAHLTGKNAVDVAVGIDRRRGQDSRTTVWWKEPATALGSAMYDRDFDPTKEPAL